MKDKTNIYLSEARKIYDGNCHIIGSKRIIPIKAICESQEINIVFCNNIKLQLISLLYCRTK